MSNEQNGVKALVEEIGNRITASEKNVINAVILENTQLKVQIDTVKARMEVIEAIVAGQKKQVTRAAKPVETVEVVAATKKNFPINKMLYFKQQFQENEEFRNKYFTPEIKEIIDNTEAVKSKTTPEAKLGAQATGCYRHINEKTPDIMKDVEKLYKDEKNKYETLAKQPQLNAGERTPPNEVATVAK